MKPKKCRGINKAREHPGCGEPSDWRKYGLCRLCFIDWMENFEEGQRYREDQFLPRLRKQIRKNRREDQARQRNKLKSIRQLINEARVPFQRWIRFRDANDACISCGTRDSELWDAGHYLKAEIYTGLIFDEVNVNKQCRKCNTFLGGNESGYRMGLVKKYGEDAVRYLEESADALRVHRYGREELIEIKKQYQKKLRDETNT